MHRTELLELIRNGEDSRLEFKRDGIENHVLAKALVAFLNLEGGTVLLGVDDDGSISGTFRDRLVEWVMEVGRVKIEPQIIPLVSWTRAVEPGRDVLAVLLTRGPDKPYACVHDGRKTYYIRAGNTSREASREELQRMYQASGRLQYGLKPVPGADLDAFDSRRLREYLTTLSYDPLPSEGRSRRLGNPVAKYRADDPLSRTVRRHYRWSPSVWKNSAAIRTAVGYSCYLLYGDRTRLRDTSRRGPARTPASIAIRGWNPRRVRPR